MSSISGTVLSGLGSSFLISRGKRNGIGGGNMRVGRKNVIIEPQRNRSLVLAAVDKDDGNSKLDPKWLDDASQKSAEFVKEKGSELGNVSAEVGQEIQNPIERAKDYIVEKAGQAMDSVAENAKKASEFVTDKGKQAKEETVSATEEAKDFIVEKSGDVKDAATDIRDKTTKYVGDKATEINEAILPPKP